MLRELLHYSAEFSHAFLDPTALVMCDGELNMTENKSVIKVSRSRVVFCRLDEFVHDEIDCRVNQNYAQVWCWISTHFVHDGNRYQGL